LQSFDILISVRSYLTRYHELMNAIATDDWTADKW